MPIDVGIAFVTGRKHFQKVLRTYVNNWLEHGLLEHKDVRLHLFVVYDTAYFNTEPSDYRNVPPELADAVKSINFYGRRALRDECQQLIRSGIRSTKQRGTFFSVRDTPKRETPHGNSAIKKNMDRLLFIDDDEYPLAVLENGSNNLLWMDRAFWLRISSLAIMPTLRTGITAATFRLSRRSHSIVSLQRTIFGCLLRRPATTSLPGRA